MNHLHCAICTYKRNSNYSKVDFMAVVSFVVTLIAYCYLTKRYINKSTHLVTDNGNTISA